MPKVNRNDVENYWLAIPPLINQKQIIEAVEIESLKIDDAIDGLHKQVSTLKEYKTTLINSAVTGKIRITPEMVV